MIDRNRAYLLLVIGDVSYVEIYGGRAQEVDQLGSIAFDKIQMDMRKCCMKVGDQRREHERASGNGYADGETAVAEVFYIINLAAAVVQTLKYTLTVSVQGFPGIREGKRCSSVKELYIKRGFKPADVGAQRLLGYI